MDGALNPGVRNTTPASLTDSEIEIVQILEVDYYDTGETEQWDAPSFPEDDLAQFSRLVIQERTGKWPQLSTIAATTHDLQVYNICLEAGTNNTLGPRIPVNTTNNIQAWRAIATGHHDDAWLIDCIQFGFPMQYRGPPLYNTAVPNHPSAANHETHVQKYISSELSMGALIGPFPQPPFVEWCNVAPLMTREKANKVDRRIIVDLSFPQGSGPNHFIEKNSVFGKLVPHSLPSVNDAVKIIITMEFDVLLSSVDISRAYRNFALDPLDWPLACIQHKGQFYIDARMPFGSRVSSLYMQKMACLLQRALILRGITTVVYLDDVLVISPRNSDPQRQFEEVIGLIRHVGLPVAWDKVTSPTRCIRFLGITIDLERKEIRIPKEKIKKFLTLVGEVKQKKYIAKRTMQMILGHINHISKGVPPARLFINRLLQCLREAHNNVIRVDCRIMRDLDWFQEFLSDFNGRSLIVDAAPTLTIEADSLAEAVGCSTGATLWSTPVALQAQCTSPSSKPIIVLSLPGCSYGMYVTFV